MEKNMHLEAITAFDGSLSLDICRAREINEEPSGLLQVSSICQSLSNSDVTQARFRHSSRLYSTCLMPDKS